jgi:hypothetical protein
MTNFKRPTLKPADVHIVVSDSESKQESEMQIYSADGKLLYRLRCLAKGQHADYKIPKGDTPPGLYKLGQLHETQQSEGWHIWRSFGKYFLDMEGQEQNEEKYGRAGCGVHGGGSGCANPLAPDQGLLPTHGCVRVLNRDMEQVIVPLYRKTRSNGGTVWMTVHQF